MTGMLYFTQKFWLNIRFNFELKHKTSETASVANLSCLKRIWFVEKTSNRFNKVTFFNKIFYNALLKHKMAFRVTWNYRYVWNMNISLNEINPLSTTLSEYTLHYNVINIILTLKLKCHLHMKHFSVKLNIS